MTACYVRAVGLLGPGLTDWTHGAQVLLGAAPYVPGEVVVPKLEVLPPVERRRTGMPVKVAMTVGMEALAAAHQAADAVASVFTSSGGDGVVMHEICETLASGDRQISPTRFHNSVHNAPAGYWSIATQSRQPSTSLCAYDWSFAAGLLEAIAQVVLEHEHVLLVSYDVPYPEPLYAARSIRSTLATALLLARTPRDGCLAQVAVALSPQPAPATRMSDAALEDLRTNNPAGRSLPLLRALAAGEPEPIALDYLPQGTLAVSVSPY
jgi:hypothetical protein